MIIKNFEMKKISLDRDSSELLGVDRHLKFLTTVKRLKSLSTYFAHCNLVDKEQNLLNGEPSSVLARFDIRGAAYEKVHYQTQQTHVLRDTSTGEYVNSLTISVRDEKGGFFDLKGFQFEFEIEIN